MPPFYSRPHRLYLCRFETTTAAAGVRTWPPPTFQFTVVTPSWSSSSTRKRSRATWVLAPACWLHGEGRPMCSAEQPLLQQLQHQHACFSARRPKVPPPRRCCRCCCCCCAAGGPQEPQPALAGRQVRLLQGAVAEGGGGGGGGGVARLQLGAAGCCTAGCSCGVQRYSGGCSSQTCCPPASSHPHPPPPLRRPTYLQPPPRPPSLPFLLLSPPYLTGAHPVQAGDQGVGPRHLQLQ